MPDLEPLQIDTWERAEANAARWMKHWGYRQVTVSPRGADAGVDVRATGALAQVKFEAHQVGRPALQRLVGARGREVSAQLLFFTGAGYSGHAVEYANEMGIALFTYTLTGSATPTNAPARAIVIRARDRAAARPPSPQKSVAPATAGASVLTQLGAAWRRAREDDEKRRAARAARAATKPPQRPLGTDEARGLTSTPVPRPATKTPQRPLGTDRARGLTPTPFPAPTKKPPAPAPAESALAGILIFLGLIAVLVFLVWLVIGVVRSGNPFDDGRGTWLAVTLGLGVLLVAGGMRRYHVVTTRAARPRSRR